MSGLSTVHYHELHAWEITHVLPLSHVPGLNVPGWCVLSLRRVDLFAERAS